MTSVSLSRRVARARYRLGQGIDYLFDRSCPDLESRLAALLTPDQRELMAGLPARDKAHQLEVHDRLWAMGCEEPELLLAALLHDCGKGDERGRAGISQRTLLVLAGSQRLGLLRRLSSEVGSGWRHGLYLAIEHPRLGATRAKATGCAERVCWLIAHHHDPAGRGDSGLSWLQAADEEG